MIKTIRIVLLTCACLLSKAAQAQVNYVLNGGFEQYSSCPTGIDQIDKAIHWHPLDTSSLFPPHCAGELCNSCADMVSHVSIPFLGGV